MKNLLMFYAGDGYAGKERVGIIMEDHAQPIAFWPKSYGDESDPVGVLALWENKCDVEDFFTELGIDHVPAPGLWVLELHPFEPAESDDEQEDQGDDWTHLSSGFGLDENLRRPNAYELMNMSEGKNPFGPGGSWA